MLKGECGRLQAARAEAELVCSEPVLKLAKFHGGAHLLSGPGGRPSTSRSVDLFSTRRELILGTLSSRRHDDHSNVALRVTLAHAGQPSVRPATNSTNLINAGGQHRGLLEHGLPPQRSEHDTGASAAGEDVNIADGRGPWWRFQIAAPVTDQFALLQQLRRGRSTSCLVDSPLLGSTPPPTWAIFQRSRGPQRGGFSSRGLPLSGHPRSSRSRQSLARVAPATSLRGRG